MAEIICDNCQVRTSINGTPLCSACKRSYENRYVSEINKKRKNNETLRSFILQEERKRDIIESLDDRNRKLNAYLRTSVRPTSSDSTGPAPAPSDSTGPAPDSSASSDSTGPATDSSASSASMTTAVPILAPPTFVLPASASSSDTVMRDDKKIEEELEATHNKLKKMTEFFDQKYQESQREIKELKEAQKIKDTIRAAAETDLNTKISTIYDALDKEQKEKESLKKFIKEIYAAFTPAFKEKLVKGGINDRFVNGLTFVDGKM